MAELILEVKNHYDSRYKTIFLGPVEDPGLSWKAKGLHTYLRTRPPGWEIRSTDLYNRSKDGRDSVESGLREIESKGYLYREQNRNHSGEFTKVIYHVYEDPNQNPYFQKALKNKDFLPQTAFPHAVKPKADNPPFYQPTKVLSSNKQPTNQNQKIGWLSNSTQKESFDLLIQKRVKSNVAKALVRDHDLETITATVENVCESGGVKNEPGLIVDRLNTIKQTEQREKEQQARQEELERQRERQYRLKQERLEREREERIAEFHQWQQSHPDGTWSQWALATTP